VIKLSSLLKLENITKVYRTNAGEYVALKNLNFTLERGEMIAIVGASGSGKSTLMNVLGFLDHCTTGKYLFSGRDVSHLEDAELATIRNKKIGFVFQSFFLLPRLNALQNVMLPLLYRGTPTDTAKQKSLDMLSKVNMQKFVDHKPNQLSGGQQQRVAIARALVGDAEVILADEPTGSLDSKTSHDVMQLFIDLNQQENRTIVVITHDNKISHHCPRVVTLHDGNVVEG